MVFKYALKNEKHITDPAELIKALGSLTKKTIVEYLAHDEAEIATLQHLFNMSYHAIYQHLSDLEKIGFVKSYKLGKEKYYVLNEDALKALLRWVTVLTNQLSASHTHYQQSDERYDFGNTQQIGSDGREKYWYSEGDI